MEYSAGAIIFRTIETERKFLIVQSLWHRTWGFPKGHLENHETTLQAAHREVFEETGLRPNFLSQFKTSLTYPVASGQDKLVTLFLAQFDEQQVPIWQPEEIVDGKWVDLKTAKDLLSRPALFNCLQEANNFLDF
ncbi:8-oxo-dGTP pyrophosphatase MutT (NUDIX family) [Lactobacillus colini]|uniref:Bis(5'-nucleosyl)-tetraphosphatase [asymmetrical] n=1 Tax=Lactobacillus colini TaxID=1819254 RepID=A0ABS4MGG3_9LACO|nr:NUDIX domain-containing protein [Lactobacillus colini]MBP2058785.1 8-oxo-dGTP pyrophosphatase MutT (NUDIX family) [Lactobacillus colini]